MKKTLHFTFKKTIETDVSLHFQKYAVKNLSDYFKDLGVDRIFIVCDENVEKLYGKDVLNALSSSFDAHLIVHQANEAGKSLDSLTALSDIFFSRGGSPGSVICALGGGTTGNIAGLLSALVYRGVRLIHIPTTLLAQLDSAADVKQSVNAPKVKNAIGLYKAPTKVIIDSTFLESLPRREVLSGLGEALKHGFAQDMSLVETIVKTELDDVNSLELITEKVIDLKIQHWRENPTIWNDTHKIERLTHLGHTSGKILEMVDIDHLTHGEAISHGMVLEAYMSYTLGYIKLEEIEDMYNILLSKGLLYSLSDKYKINNIMSRLYSTPEGPIFALLRKLGDSQTISTQVTKEVTQQALEWYFQKLNRTA